MLYGPEIGIESVDEFMEFLVGKLAVDLIDSIYAECIWKRGAVIQRFQPVFQIRCVSESSHIHRTQDW